MPSLQDIEQFKQYLNSLGNEPGILAERGETIRDIEQPEEGLSEDLADLFGEAGEGPEELEEGLDTLPVDFLDQAEEEPAGTEASFEESGGTEEADLGFTMPEETEEETFDTDVPGGESFELPELGEEDAGDEFALPQFGEEPAEVEEPFEEPAGTEESFDTVMPGEESFEIPEFGEEDSGDEFALPEFGEEPAGAEEPLEGPAEESFEEFGEEPFEEPGEDFAEPEGAIDEFLGTGEQEEAIEAGAIGEESFEMPEFGEEDAGDEFALPQFGEEPESGPGEEAEEEFVLPGGEEEQAPPTGEEEEGLPGELLEGEDFGDLETLEDEGFNLDFEELGDHFGISGEEAVEEAVGEPVVMAEAAGVEDLHEGDEDYEIEDDEFEAVKGNLSVLPRNLKLAVEDLIGEKGLAGERLRSLVSLLIAGASAKEIASQVSRITGKKIEIPAQYQKKTGLEFEAEKGTFRYAFRQNILPMLRIFVPAVLLVLLLAFIGVRFVYKPIKAWSLYKTGYEEIYESRFDSANSYFERAYSVHRVKKWFYTYAEGFIEQKKFRYAEETYKKLLADYPEDRKGLLDISRLQGMILGKYEEAEGNLRQLFRKDKYDREALIISGDMYMQWAITEPEHYEDARRAYAALISAYGPMDEFLFRMLRYFIRTDNYEEVIRLKLRYEAAEDAEIDPVVYAEMGGYLIDKGELEDVRSILFRAMDEDETVPEIHYNLARLFRADQEYTEEDKALEKAVYYLENEEARTPDREAMLINAYTRTGERLYERERYLDAETYFINAREHYEKALRMRTLAPREDFGKIYSHLGDIYYYQEGDLNTAEVLFDLAEANAYSVPDLDFKRGYIYFRREDYKNALLRFYESAEGFSTNENLLYSTGNSLFERGDFFAAQGYYDHLIDSLENREKNTAHFLIDERPDHRALLSNLMKVYNNLGVTLYNLSLKTGDETRIGDALYYFTESIELYDYLTRDPETLEGAETVNLAYLNSRSILYPVGNYRLQVYRDIPRDMTELFF